MAHHDSTPRSILDAPTRTETAVSEQHGLSRAERRHGMRPVLAATPADANTLTAAALLVGQKAINTPHLRGTPQAGLNAAVRSPRSRRRS